MRKLRIMVRMASGSLPLVVAASVVPIEACSAAGESSGSSAVGGRSGAGGANTGGRAPAMGGSTAGQPILVITGGIGAGGSTPGGGGGQAGAPSCRTDCDELFVDLPEEGVPAEPGQICAASVEPVTSNRAAFLTFDTRAADGSFAGSMLLAPELAGLIVGTPAIDVVEGSSPALSGLVFSNITSTPGGFTFVATPAGPVQSTTTDIERVTLRTTLEIGCDGATRVVHSVTEIYFCSTYGQVTWASSGESCCVCRVIAEMAPSPIVPGEVEDELPLAQALRLRIVELARISNTVILLAENDGGDGLDYEWFASVGSIERLAPDVIAWTLSEGVEDPLVQAAVSGPRAAAVASFAFNERAA